MDLEAIERNVQLRFKQYERTDSRRVNRAAFKEEEVQKLPDRHIMTLTPHESGHDV